MIFSRRCARIAPGGATLLLLASVYACADAGSHREAERRPVPELAPATLVSVCDNTDNAGCTLGPLVGALPRADGSIIVAHHGGPLFRFDSTGAFVDSLGRSGRGPGEFESIWEFGEGVGDSVGIVDVRGLRVAWIPPGGVGGRNEPIPFEPFMEAVLVSQHGSFMLAVPGTDTAGARVNAYVTRFANEATRRHASVPAISYRMPNSDMSRIAPILAPRTHWCVTPTGRMAVASGDEWTVHVFDSAGAMQRVDLPGLPRDRIELADLQRVARRWGRHPARQDSMAQRQMDSLPERTHPTVLKLACDDAVIMLVTSGNASRSTQRWRVIDWSGRELVRLQLPSDAQLSRVGHGRFTVLRSNEQSGLEWVEVYAMPSPGG